MIGDNARRFERLPLPVTESFDPSLVILGALALFVIWKLRSVLGVRVDRDNPAAPSRFRPLAPPAGPQGPRAAPSPGASFAAAENGKTPSDRWKDLAEPGGKALAGLDAIAKADRDFSAPAFLEGARKAYGMIVDAFAKGDRDLLGRLLAREVFDSFAREIEKREERGETAEARLASLDSALIEDARTNAGALQITVRFNAKLVCVRRDGEGRIVEGDPSEPMEVIDLWTFAREIAARDPNWRLIATESSR